MAVDEYRRHAPARQRSQCLAQQPRAQALAHPVAPHHGLAHVALGRAAGLRGQVAVKVGAQAKSHRAQKLSVLQRQHAVVAALGNIVQVFADAVFGQVVPDIGVVLKNQRLQRGQVLGTCCNNRQAARRRAHRRGSCISTSWLAATASTSAR